MVKILHFKKSVEIREDFLSISQKNSKFFSFSSSVRNWISGWSPLHLALWCFRSTDVQLTGFSSLELKNAAAFQARCSNFSSSWILTSHKLAAPKNTASKCRTIFWSPVAVTRGQSCRQLNCGIFGNRIQNNYFSYSIKLHLSQFWKMNQYVRHH